MNKNLIDFAASLARAPNTASAAVLLEAQLRELGVERFNYALIPRNADGSVDGLISVDTFDEEWMRFYTEHELFKGDLAATHCLSGGPPLKFAEMYRAIDQGAADGQYKRTADLTRDFGFRNGVAIPISTRRQVASAISIELTRDFSEGEYLDCYAAHERDIRLVAEVFHAHMDQGALAAEHYGVTPRETEVLQWLADGLIAKQIAHRIGTSVHTVNKHIANAKQRLNAATTTQAVARAIALNLI